jgi:hypothetical protein
MNRVALSTYPGSFRLPRDVRLWLLREREAYHLFNFGRVDESNFALKQVEILIFDEDVAYAGTYDEEWGWFNDSIVYLEGDLLFCEVKFTLKSGEEHRTDSGLIEAIEKFGPEDFEIVEAPESFKVETRSDGEYLLNRRSIVPDEQD